jgi:lipoprotein NlpD
MIATFLCCTVLYGDKFMLLDASLSTGSRIVAGVSVSLLWLSLAACSSSYQAPVDDRSAALEREAPIIISDGQTVPLPQRQTAAAPASTQAVVGASTTVVTPVAVGRGIQRTSRVNEAQPDSVVPQSAPVAVSGSLPQETRSAEQGIHVVARGDTLYSIAWTYNLDVRSLALANNLSAPYTIFPGQRLQVQETSLPSAAIEAVPAIPAAPAGEVASNAGGGRPQAAVDARRVGSVNTRQMEGVSWQWPADGRLLSTFTASGSSRGINIAGMQGQPVYAAADGDVVYSGRGIQGAGNLVILRHSARHLSAYMYNSALIVSEGDAVRAGDKIAEMGSGPDGRDMLHFEVRLDGKPVDPVRYLPSR